MITFNSQEEFENAVMAVLDRRLRIKLNTYDDCGGRFLEVVINDHITNKYFTTIDYDNTTIGVAA